MTITITGLDPETHQSRSFPLELTAPDQRARVGVAALPGSGPVHLLVESDGNPFSVEIDFPASDHLSDEQVLEFRIDEAGKVRVSGHGGMSLTVLPRDDDTGIDWLLYPVVAPQAIDIVILIDGTCRPLRHQAHSVRVSARSLEPMRPEGAEKWDGLAKQLTALVKALIGDCQQARFRVLAYGDHPLPDPCAEDLKPAYLLYPPVSERRRFERFSEGLLRQKLLQVPGTSGGDFLDALGEALDECAFALPWNTSDTTRRVLIIFGESPGLMLMSDRSNLPAGANGVLVRADIETPLAALHRDRKVEVITIYHEPEAGSVSGRPDVRAMLNYAKHQFREVLPSCPGLGRTTADLDPEALAQVWQSLRTPLRRFRALGLVRLTTT